MIEGKSRSASVAIGVLKALHLLNAENHPTTLEAICGWLATSENFYYDDWLTVGGRSAMQYIADLLEDLRELGVVRIVERNTGAHSQTSAEWSPCLLPSA
ncbi:hypothetical protein [Paraburkholderia caledonica]|uniref:Uncharacterized protein n=1 Tax=Paraburkholderia caledonica TaxID=134536 RepID=A0AB73IER9_9BURK|nr:hypothetical protein [Paraburkholderia caledonica]